jgi:ferritin-like metal-binding protein YciE
VDALSDLLEDEVRDLFNAEHQLMRMLPRMARCASSQALKAAFISHFQETQNQVRRLEEIGRELDMKLTVKSSHAVQELLDEGNDAFEEWSYGTFTDAALIVAAQRVQQYEIAGYDTARAMAEALEHARVANLLQQAFDKEDAADKQLADIAEEEGLSEALAICAAGAQ